MMTGWLNSDWLANLTFLNCLDVVMVLTLLYGSYRAVRHTRAVALTKGLIIVVAVFAAAALLDLQIMRYILEKSVYFLGVAVAVVFAPELRRALEQLGNTAIAGGGTKLTRQEVEDVLQAVQLSVANLSRRRVGALMVFQIQTDLGETVESGIRVDGLVSSGLLINIFEKNTPLHDGAVVIQGERLVAATCYLPMTEQTLSKELGTRHRAAIGLSEQSDAIIVIVSEETGDISVARNGELLRYLRPEDVRAILMENLYRDLERTYLARLLPGCFKK